MPIPAEEVREQDRKIEAKNQIKKFLNENPAKFSEIVENVDRSKSTVSRYLKEFKEKDVIYQDEDNCYHLQNMSNDEKRILSEIVEKGMSEKEEVSDSLNLTVNLNSKLEKLIELNYLSGTPEAFSVTNKTLGLLDKSITGERLDDQMVVNTVESDGFSSYQVSFDPVLRSPKDFLGFCPDLPNNVQICNHCGLPLNPKYIKAIVTRDPENPEDTEVSEEMKQKLDEIFDRLYGPVGSVYRLFRDYQSNEEWTEKHYNTYRKDGESYHPHCYKVIENEN